MENEAKFWDQVAEKYAKSPISDYKAYEQTLERTRSHITTSDNVLEIGCGTGSTALLLAKSANHITATDLSPAMIRIGKDKADKEGVSNVEFMAAEAESTAVGNEPYDAVLAFNILHLLKDLPGALQHINKKIKPGGLFISKTVCKPEKIGPLKFRLMMIILPIMQMVGKVPYVKIIKSKEFDKLITSSGFKIIEVGNYPANPPHRYIVAQKL